MNERRPLRDTALALLVPVLFLVGAEVALRVSGVQPMPPRRESIIHYQKVDLPLTKNFDSTRADWAGWDKRLRKPSGAPRVFCFGGSAVHGWEIPEFSFPRQLEPILKNKLGRPVEVFNFGAVGWSSLQVLTAIQETLQSYHPDLVVVYSGNNEMHEVEAMKLTLTPAEVGHRVFLIRWRNRLERWRLFLAVTALVRKIRGPVERAPVDVEDEFRMREWPPHNARDRVFAMELFSHHLNEIARVCQARGVPLVLATVATNLRARIESDDLPAAYRESFAEIKDRVEAGDFETARARLDALRDPAFASEVTWYRAWVLENEGRHEEAFAAYRDAAERSVPPIRALPPVNGIVHDVAKRYGLPVVDVAARIHAMSHEGLCCLAGGPLSDHVHFTKEGHRIVAAMFADSVLSNGLLQNGRSADTP